MSRWWMRVLWWFVARASLVGLALVGAVVLNELVFHNDRPYVGVDYILYRDATQRWLSGGGFYLPHQLAGPYAIHFGTALDILYPPVVLWLLVPFTVLPAWTWWAVPIGLTAWAFARLRPAPWTWPIFLGVALWSPPTIGVWLWGGPSMWIAAFGALGVVYGWPAVLVLIKPTLAPFAAVGIGRRSWWLGLAVFAFACLPFGAMWADWWRAAIVNPTNGGLSYSLVHFPVMSLPVIAWLGRGGDHEPVLDTTRRWTREVRERTGRDRRPPDTDRPDHGILLDR